MEWRELTMKLAITGATGFLGQRACEYLQERDHHVIGLGRNNKKGLELTAAGIPFVQADLSDVEQLTRAFKGVEVVIHSAAKSEPWGKYDDFYQSNVIGTQNVLVAANKANVKRVIHISSPSIYFRYNSRHFVEEEEPVPKKFVNAYAKTKFLAEGHVQNVVRQGREAIILRPRALFGPRDTTILPRLIELNSQRGFPLPNKGKSLVDLTYIDNVVRAIELALTAPKQCIGEAYNITNGEPVYLRAALQQLFTALHMPMNSKVIPYSVLFCLAAILEGGHKVFMPDKEPILTRYSVSVLGKTQTLSIEKARKDLGYEPVISIQEGIERYATWWHEQNKRCEDI